LFYSSGGIPITSAGVVINPQNTALALPDNRVFQSSVMRSVNRRTYLRVNASIGPESTEASKGVTQMHHDEIVAEIGKLTETTANLKKPLEQPKSRLNRFKEYAGVISLVLSVATGFFAV
jgi:hypothetical protein